MNLQSKSEVCPYAIDERSGARSVTLGPDEILPHNHVLNVSGATGTLADPNGVHLAVANTPVGILYDSRATGAMPIRGVAQRRRPGA